MPSIRIAAVILALAAACGGAQAQGPATGHVLPPWLVGKAYKPLEHRDDVVPWRLFAQVELVRLKDRYVPQYSDNVWALDRKDVRIQGFMIPLDMGEKQSHFILSQKPQTCMFCMPGGPESLVEVKTSTPLQYTFEPLVLSGHLSVLKADPTGIFYRLTDARQAD
jgi:uncharacterized protein